MSPAALEFLATRRSRPARTLGLPVPDRAAVMQMLTIAARVPDHGKLEPWRFIALEQPALRRLAALADARAAALGLATDRAAKGREQFSDGNLVIAVVASPKGFDRIPEVEQTLSTGAVCLSLVNAVLASGWGANWLTGWPAYDRGFVETGLGLADHEWIAGFIHVGTPSAVPPDRPRPDIDAITTWADT